MKTESQGSNWSTRTALWLGLMTFVISTSSAQQQALRIGDMRVPSGETRSGFLAVPRAADGETFIPVTVFHGIKPGPTLGLIAGNHGYEYSPILALQRILTKIDAKKLSGNLLIVHVANMPSFLKRTIYYSPVDGKNLNRVYPGKENGTLSERTAYVITKEIIERSDYVVDLHCGDGNESLRPYSYWMPIDDQKVDEPSKTMAIVFGLDHIVVDRGRPKDPNASAYCSNTAMTRGKPAITIESGGLGQAYDEAAMARIERGVFNLLHHFGMLEGKPVRTTAPHWFEPTEVLRFPIEGLPFPTGIFYPKVEKDQRVEKGALLGIVTDFFGKIIYEVRAPFAGQVLYILGTPPVSAGEPLAFVAAPRATAP